MRKHNPTNDLSSLVRLVHHRWSIPIIAELQQHSGAKFVTLLNHLNMSRAPLTAALSHLIDLGQIRKNTGHGHPMRPEYLLTRKGQAIAEDCVSLIRLLQRNNDTDLALRKWTLPLVAAIGDRRMRFSELRNTLENTTPRALTIGIKALLQQGWAERRLIDDFPPTAVYALSRKGRRYLAIIEKLY